MENLEAGSLEAERLDLFGKLEKLEKEHAKCLAGLSEKETQKYLVIRERDNKQLAIGSAIGTLIQNYDNRDLLTHHLIGTLWALGDSCIDWFPSKSADALLEELFKPVFNNVTPELRPEKSSDLHQFFQFIRAVECCANALKFGNTSNQKRRDKAWASVLEAFSYYVEIYNGKQLPVQDFSKLGAMGAQVRWVPNKKLEAWAVEKYRAKEWPSANKAAHDLKDQVREYGRTIGATLTEENAQRTIADWFRKANKSV